MVCVLYVRLANGIGNRFFKYASAKGIAAKLGGAFNVLESTIDGEHSNRTYDWFVQRVSAHICTHPPAASQSVMVYNQPDAEHIGVVTDLRCGFHNHDSILLNGYFQCEENFANIKDELRDLFCGECPAISSAIDMYYPRARNHVALHIRLGDYIHTPHFVNLQKYYERCIQALPNNTHFLIICEDPENIHSIYPSLLPFITQQQHTYTLVQERPSADVVDSVQFDLYLMARCAGVICSNSTFAWWGAWIGLNRLRGSDNNHTQVFIPDKWLQGNSHVISMDGATVVLTS